MGIIINKKGCNDLYGSDIFTVQSSNPSINTYTGYCPTYNEIISTNKFNINGIYQNNQLVQKNDLNVKGFSHINLVASLYFKGIYNESIYPSSMPSLTLRFSTVDAGTDDIVVDELYRGLDLKSTNTLSYIGTVERTYLVSEDVFELDFYECMSYISIYNNESEIDMEGNISVKNIFNEGGQFNEGSNVIPLYTGTPITYSPSGFGMIDPNLNKTLTLRTEITLL